MSKQEVSYREAVLKALQDRGMSIRGLSEAVQHSYEHCRKIVTGEPVVSRELNKRLCQVLRLPEREMWTIARREKAAARFGPDLLSGVLDRQGQTFYAFWTRLEPSDRAILVRIAAGLVAVARKKRRVSERTAVVSEEKR